MVVILLKGQKASSCTRDSGKGLTQNRNQSEELINENSKKKKKKTQKYSCKYMYVCMYVCIYIEQESYIYRHEILLLV